MLINLQREKENMREIVSSYLEVTLVYKAAISKLCAAGRDCSYEERSTGTPYKCKDFPIE